MSVKSFVSLNPIVLKFEVEVFSGVIFTIFSSIIEFENSSVVSKNNG